ncbi:MAG: AMP-dependent synthetase/ligase [Vulcanimicrobiaceae bacterium]
MLAEPHETSSTELPTLARFIREALAEPRERAFAERLGAPDWRLTSSLRMLERAGAIARALRTSGIARGERVALVANNSVDWLAADFGILLAGAVVVPVFATIALDQLDFIFSDADAKLAFVESEREAARIGAGCPHAPRLIAFGSGGPDGLEAFEARGGVAASDASEALDGFTNGIEPSELAVLIYTSGTTGNPKGVMLSHRNLVSNARASGTVAFQVLGRGEPVLAVLPFAHIYEHTDVLGYVDRRWELSVTRPEFLLADLRDARPRTIALVPRIFERVLAGIVGKAQGQGGLAARLVPWSLGVARAYGRALADGVRPSPAVALAHALAARLVYRKIVVGMGLDRLAFFVSGSAPLHRDIALTFLGMGLPIAEGYGLTETSPVVSVNPPGAIRYGTVGRAIPDVEIKIAQDGEVLVRGPNVMQGYYGGVGEPPFTADGWFKTGDIGELDADGYLRITDRKKELIKTSGGKYLAPGRIEAALKRSLYVGQCMVVGDSRPFPIALIVPNWDLVRQALSLPAGLTTAAVAARDDVHALLAREASAKTADLAIFEQIRRVALLPRDLTIEDGELSPTLKVRRRIVESRYAALIDAAYA